MKILILVFTFLLAKPCYAGGDFVKGLMVEIRQNKKVYSMKFTQTQSRQELITGCKNMTIILNTKRPWFSWLKPSGGLYPSHDETMKAIIYLNHAKDSGKEIYFGYLGDGLQPTDEKCTFTSKALSLRDEDDKRIIFSFNNPI